MRRWLIGVAVVKLAQKEDETIMCEDGTKEFKLPKICSHSKSLITRLGH